MKLKSHITYGLIGLAAALCGCGHSEHGHDHEHEHEHAHEHEHGAKAAVDEDAHAHGPGVIVLDEHLAERFGVGTDTIAPGTFNNVVRAAGRVESAGSEATVVVAPTAGIVRFGSGIAAGREVGAGTVVATVSAKSVSGGSADEAARAELDNARRELQRLEGLAAEHLATAAEVAAARAAYDRAAAAYSPAAAEGAAKAPRAGRIGALLVSDGQYVGVGEPIATVTSGQGSVLRIDLPASMYARAAAFTDANIVFADADPVRVSDLGGRRSGTGELAGGYVPLYFTAPTGAPAGTPFTAYLIGAARQGVLSVPVKALSEQQGRFYVYRHTGGEHYEKVPVTVGVNNGVRAEITAGIATGDVVVTRGTSAVRLAETLAVAPEGHSHNH